MGEVLSKPVTETHSSKGCSKNLIYGQSCMQGYRKSMEDAHAALPELKIDSSKTIAYFGVFDGHNGSYVSKACSERLHELLISLPSFKNGDYVTALKEAFVNLDEIFIEEKVKDGSAAIVILITEDRRLFVANAGDCRVVLSTKGGYAVALSEDHKPSLPSETERIKKAGGMVSYITEDARLNGVFSLSRSFGDIDHKRNDLPPEERAMSVYPEIETRQLASEDEFIVLACDGIWTVASNENIVDLTRQYLSKKYELDKICELIMFKCLDLKSLDNMSVVIVGLLYGKTKEAWYAQFEGVTCSPTLLTHDSILPSHDNGAIRLGYNENSLKKSNAP